MEFIQFTLPIDVFPRFHNASTKSLELHSRYTAMLCKSERPSLRENRQIRLYLSRNRDEIEFPVEIGSCIAETVKTRNFNQGEITKSRNINSFLKSQEESDSYISVLVVDISAKKEIYKLGPTKFLFVLVTEDARVKKDFEEEIVRHDKPIITVAGKVSISTEIDNLLERISLAPLKVIGERCYEKFQQTAVLADTTIDFPDVRSTIISQTGSKGKTLANKNGQTFADNSTSKRNGLYNTKKPCAFQPSQSGHGLTKAEKPYFSMFTHHQNGSAVPSNMNQYLEYRPGKANSYDVKTKNVQDNVSATIYTRSKRKGGTISMLNGLKDKVPSTKSSENKESKRILRKRLTETDRATALKDKRRKKGSEGSDQISLSDTEDQSSSSDNINEEENPERLLEAILAVYGMSNVPEAERPNVPKQSCVVSKEMRNELFKLCPTIKRMGYRYRTFYIYATKLKSQTDEANKRTQICSVLKRYGICHFKIAPCAESVTKLMHVGAEIEVRPRPAYSLRSRRQIGLGTWKGGTLGCFVDMNDGEGQCGLLSKHVTEHVSDVYHVGQGNERKIGYMLEDTNRYQYRGLDISAALMREHTDDNGTKFKDTRQTLLKGQLHDYNDELDDAICRSGQSVHIYGAKSNPGKGEITMPCVDVGLSTPLIQVEDQISDSGTVKGHFAERGDSGAIVCVEDPEGKKVHALSMVMGAELNETARRKYLTIPLSKGLKQLEENTGKTFKLC